MVGKELDRLLKGRFFQVLLPKWQRKLGHPKADESFEELYGRARTAERHDQQYKESAAGRDGPRHKGNDRSKRVPNSNSRSEPQKEEPQQGSKESEGSQESREHSGSPICFNCRGVGHIARYCRKPRQGSEATGRSNKSTKSTSLLTTIAEMTDQQLEDKLHVAARKLKEEQGLLDDHSMDTSAIQMIRVSRAVGPTVQMELLVEGLKVPAVVDTGSQSTIISRALLHDIKRHLEGQGKSMPKLELPRVKLFGKDGSSEKPLNIMAQVRLTFEAGGQTVTVPAFVQPESEQQCLIGMNVIPLLGISIRRVNGEPLVLSADHKHNVAHVSLLKTITIPSMKGRFVEARVNEECFLISSYCLSLDMKPWSL